MSENTIAISNLNDFIFCPVSIYFHLLDNATDKLTYQDKYQLNGTAAHSAIDEGRYSTSTHQLQAIDIYCEKYNLYGKIDLFNTKTGVLTERKKHITNIYDGYIFQIYAQYFRLSDMGYSVKALQLYSLDDNKVYPIKLPNDDIEMFSKFEKVIFDINNFKFDNFKQTNPKKCEKCIYEPLCSFSCAEVL